MFNTHQEIVDYIRDHGETDFFVYSLEFKPELNFARSGHRMIPLQQVKGSLSELYYVNDVSFKKYGKKGQLLSATIPFHKNRSCHLKVFLDEQEATASYHEHIKQKKEELKTIKEKYIKRINDLSDSFDDSMHTFLNRRY